MQKVILIFHLFLSYTYFCNATHAAWPNVTDKNFREKVSVWDHDTYHFYRPEESDIWSMCTEDIKAGDLGCRLIKYIPQSTLNIKHYEISFKSALPIKKEWLDTVIHEMLNQERLSYFTVYYVQSFIQNLAKQDYKNCNYTPKETDNCVHSMQVRLLAYNDPNALRNGVIYDAGYPDGELFPFYKIYTSNGQEKSEAIYSLLVIDYTDQAWEVTQKVNPLKRSYDLKYDIKRYSQSVLANSEFTQIDWAEEFDRCKKNLMDKNKGRFSKENECYCNCVQEKINIELKKFATPTKVALEIIESSYSTCDWANTWAINYYNQQLEELFSKSNWSKFDECRHDVFREHTGRPWGKSTVNMCNIEDIISNIAKCSWFQ